MNITEYHIALAESELLLEEDFSSGPLDPEQWLEVGSASWAVEDGALEGKWDEGGELEHGQIFSQRRFQGDILMEFEAETVPPCDHDIIWWWGVRLNGERDGWQRAYLGGLGSWYTNKTGVERHEDEKVTMTMTPLFALEAGRRYKIQCGMVNDTLFFFVDGQLIMELVDPDPLIKKGPGRIGFSAYQSHIRYSRLRVYKPKSEPIKRSY